MATSAQRIDRYLRKYGSPLAGLGAVFVAEGKRNGVNPGLLVAIAGAESSFGKVNSGSHNAWGWGPGHDFPSWQSAIGAIARGLRNGYLNEGRTTIQQIGAKWAPQGAANDPTNLNSNWVQNVRKFYRELGGGGTVGGAVSPSVTTGGANIGSYPSGASGGLQDAAFQNLSDIASGHYDPLRSLSSLAQGIPAGTTSGMSPAPTGGGSVTVRPGGGWGGSKGVASSLVSGLGLSVTSEKRDRKNTSSGGVSDHWTGSKNAYAYDLGGSVSSMDNAAVRLARSLGISYRKGQPLVATVNRGGYRIQILYRTSTGGNHYDHIHVGVRRV